jgi:hypothetical protein
MFGSLVGAFGSSTPLESVGAPQHAFPMVNIKIFDYLIVIISLI